MIMILYFLLMLMVLVSIAFFTLLERKILGYIQFRKGPDKILLLGVFQPFVDGMKLFMKENSFNFNLNKVLFNLFPLFMLVLMFMFWQCYCYYKYNMLVFSMVYLMVISGFSVYGIMGSGWSSNSKYGLLGAYRSVAQVISYEVSMIFMIIFFFMFNKNYMLLYLFKLNINSINMIYGLFNLFMIWFVIILAELNRAPFDFSESESELVSGFNVEFGSIKFAFLFLSEYGNMIFMCFLTLVLFLSINNVGLLLLMSLMIWIRGSFPRYRYDNLMYLNWKNYLPFILVSVLCMMLWINFNY